MTRGASRALTPGLDRLQNYDRAWLRGDVVAGVTVAAYLVPQCMAYAEIAGLEPVVGLWAILAPLLVYAVLGSSPQLSVGPESTTAIMTASAVGPIAAANGGDYAALCAVAALLVGAFCILAWVARLGFLASLLSRPILVGYLAGVALIMISGQLDKVAGIDIEADTFAGEVSEFVREFSGANNVTVLLAAAVLVALFLLAHFAPRLPGPLIAVLGAVVLVAVFDLQDQGVSVVGEVPRGLPRPQLPNVALEEVYSLVPAAIGIALVGYSDNVLTARGFAKNTRSRVDANQELLALGGSNIGAGLMQGFPISSSGSRTTIGDATGSRSQLYSLVTFLSVLAVLFLLGPLLAQFPDAALGALVIWAATQLIDVPEFRRLLRFRRSEFLLALATTVGVLFTDILVGVAIAIGLSVLDLIARISRPHDAVLGLVPGVEGYHDVEDWEGATTIPGLFIYRYDAPLFFANADDFRDSALEELERTSEPVEWFLLQAEAIGRVDSTAIQVLGELIEELERRGIVVAAVKLKTDLTEQLARTGILERIGTAHVYPTLASAVEAFHERR